MNNETVYTIVMPPRKTALLNDREGILFDALRITKCSKVTPLSASHLLVVICSTAAFSFTDDLSVI
jgi:hypothetical protein